MNKRKESDEMRRRREILVMLAILLLIVWAFALASKADGQELKTTVQVKHNHCIVYVDLTDNPEKGLICSGTEMKVTSDGKVVVTNDFLSLHFGQADGAGIEIEAPPEGQISSADVSSSTIESELDQTVMVCFAVGKNDTLQCFKFNVGHINSTGFEELEGFDLLW